MTGDKPDPRLRTPMQWRPGPGAGFTTGTPWESLQPDSLTTTVETEEADSGSLLHWYRRLIRLRREDEALATGRLVPLETGRRSVVAYLRRGVGEGYAVLVVVNLGADALPHVTISGSKGSLRPGVYRRRTLPDGQVGASLQVVSDGRILNYDVGAVGPRSSLLFDLRRQ